MSMYFFCDVTRAHSASIASRTAYTTFDTPMTVAMAKQTTSDAIHRLMSAFLPSQDVSGEVSE